MAISITKPTVGGSEDTWGTTINTALDTIVDGVNGTSGTIAPDLSTLTINGTDVTATAAELNILDGVTSTTAELNILDGVTSTAAELNILDGVTATTAELNIMDGVTATTAEINKLDGFTGVAADLNYAKDLRATGVTTTELDVLDGITATTAELNIMDGVTATTAELNYVDGVTSNIQTQIDAKAPTASPSFTGSASFAGAVDVDAAFTANSLAIDNGSNDWTFEVSSNKLIIKYGGTAKMELDTSGNLTVTGDVNTNGTIS